MKNKKLLFALIAFFSFFYLGLSQNNISAFAFSGVCFNNNESQIRFDLSQAECTGSNLSWISNFNTLEQNSSHLCFERGSGNSILYFLLPCRSSSVYYESNSLLTPQSASICPEGTRNCFRKSSSPNNIPDSTKLLILKESEQTFESCYSTGGQLSNCNDTNSFYNGILTGNTGNIIDQNNPNACINKDGDKIACPFTLFTTISVFNRQNITTSPSCEISRTLAANCYVSPLLSTNFDLVDCSTLSLSSEVSSDLAQNLIIINDFLNSMLVYLFILLGAILALRGASIGSAIVKSADEPEERNKKLKSLIQFVIGIFAIALILMSIGPLLNVFINLLN